MNIVELQTVGSTNDYAKELAKKGAASGLTVWAHEQTAGRGRQGNAWVSIPGNLFMTMVLRPRADATNVGQLSFLCAVALANVLSGLAPKGTEISLKWPNDLLINRKKAAGILIETEGHASWAVAGIGVNITSAPENAVCLRDIGVDCTAGDVLESLVREILRLFAEWEEGGFGSIRKAWLQRAYRLNEEITARLPKETLKGIFKGIDETGALLLQLPDGTLKAINSGEVFL